MAELNDQQQSETVQPKPPRKSRSGLWLGFGIVFSALCLGGLIFYFDVQHKAHQQELAQKLNSELDQKDQQVLELTQQISGYQTQIAAIQSQLANVQQDSSGKDTHFNQTLDDFSKLYTEKLDVTRTELKGSIDQVHRLLSKTRSDWLLADAEFLLSIANERIQLIGDVVTAKKALDSAETRLRDSDDPAVVKVREQLGKEIELISKIKPLDVIGIYAKLNALQQAANQLTLFLPHESHSQEKPVEQESPDQTKTNANPNWLGNTLQKMKGYVSIRHSSKPIEGIISKEEVQFIIQQLKIRLELVKMALVQQNEELYLASIEDTKQWLNENFALDAKGKDFANQINELQAIKLRSQLPVISESLKMLKDITKLRSDSDKILPVTPPAQPANNSESKVVIPGGIQSPKAIPNTESERNKPAAVQDKSTALPASPAAQTANTVPQSPVSVPLKDGEKPVESTVKPTHETKAIGTPAAQSKAPAEKSPDVVNKKEPLEPNPLAFPTLVGSGKVEKAK